MTAKNFTCLAVSTVFVFAALCSGPSRAGEEGLSSTLELMEAYGAANGIRVVQPADVQGRSYTEDYSASQVLEIVRPDGGPVSVSRLATTCSCVQAVMTKKTFAQGERAFIEIRNVKPSLPDGAVYGVFVVLESPFRIPLQAEVFVKSDRVPAPPPAPATATGK